MDAREDTHRRNAVARPVAITGMGIISCIGSTLEEVTESLYAGKSGIVLDEARRRAGFRSALTGRIRDFEPALYGCSMKMLRTMGEPSRYAYAATTEAVRDAGLRPADLRDDRCGVVFGNDSTIQSAVESIDILRAEGETHFIGGGHIFRAMNSTVSMNLAAILGLRGASWSVSAACASGAHAIGQALMLIRSGLQDVVIAGGTQETNMESMASFDALGAFSTRQEPEKASRPFDADRDGLVPSGGAAALVLESLDHARARGARIHGTLVGYGFSSDGSGHLSRPLTGGAVRAMRMALDDACMEPGGVDYVNAHATSTPVGDRAEAAAIMEVFGGDVPVTSTKSMTGHECWMAGASELVYTVLMARGGFIAPNINFARRDDSCAPINVIDRTTSCRMRAAVSNSFGFGGTNAVLVVGFSDEAQKERI